MMNQPTGRTAPDSSLPPALNVDLRHTPKFSCKTSDLIADGVKQRMLDFARDPMRDKHPQMIFPVAEYADDIRSYVGRVFREKMVGSSRQCTYLLSCSGMSYAVEVTDCGREGFLLTLISSTPTSPASDM